MCAASREWYESAALYSQRHDAQRRKPPQAVLRLNWRYRQLLRLLPPRQQKLLDVGCGTGEFVYLANALGYDAGGIDFDRRSIERGRQLYQLSSLRSGSVNDLIESEGRERYEILTLFDVLEHIEDPLKTTAELAPLLVAGGHLAVNVPAWPRWPPLLAREGDYPPHHLTLWSEQAVRRTLEGAGLVLTALRRKPLEGSDLFDVLRSHAPWMEGPPLWKRLFRQGLWKGLCMPLAYVARLYPPSGGFALFALGRKS